MSTPAADHEPGSAPPPPEARPASGRASAEHPTAARARSLTKAYGSGETAVVALDGVDVDVRRGRFTAVMGPSGSGKSTLMHCLAGLDTVSAGQVWLGGTEITGLKDRELTRLRRDRVGFMFQSFNLIPTLSALENITLPMSIAGRRPDTEWVDRVVDTLGLRDRLRHRPAQLSGGQQQRVACARALASRPELIFADEPTGNLDSRAGLEVLGFLREAVDELGQTVVMVTHDPTAAAHSDLVLFLADGRIVDEMERPSAEGVLERMKRFDVTRAPDGEAPAPAEDAGRSLDERPADGRSTDGRSTGE
ncbi:ATP-binding cassette domain-containing protein [Streptomyces sp. NPDC008150]|uniref:ABC transporter ATP-binding protein n=1 Tax=Streptomyces sp. NPDC008150 TaxID=3364816 RepID=UPI0036F13B77